MQLVSLLMEKLAIMLLFMAIGFVLDKTKVITETGSKAIASLLIHLVLPAVIINSFCVERTAQRMAGLGISLLFAAATLLVSFVVSALLFKKNPIANFASSFSNPGFFGIPLILSVLGSEAVFYVAMFIAFINLGQWSYGVGLLNGQGMHFDPKRIIKSPFMVGLLIGLVLFLCNVKLPGVISSTLKMTTELNTPLAMIVTGIYMAHTDWKKMLTTPSVFGVTGSRLLLIPLLSIPVLWLIPAQYAMVRMALMIAVACPVGSNVAVYAQLYKQDYPYAVQTVVVSSLAAVASMPLLLSLVQLIW